MTIRKLARLAALGAALLGAPASVLAETHACIVKEVRSFSDRVHVRCANKPCAILGGSGCSVHLPIVFFAVPASDWNMALRFATTASSALGGVLDIDWKYYDASATSFGCLLGDCRRALSFRLKD